MIRHVVMFKLKPEVSPARRDEWLEMSISRSDTGAPPDDKRSFVRVSGNLYNPM